MMHVMGATTEDYKSIGPATNHGSLSVVLRALGGMLTPCPPARSGAQIPGRRLDTTTVVVESRPADIHRGKAGNWKLISSGEPEGRELEIGN